MIIPRVWVPTSGPAEVYTYGTSDLPLLQSTVRRWSPFAHHRRSQYIHSHRQCG